jgi:hypothetical protein
MSTSCSGLVRSYVACLRDTPCMKVRARAAHAPGACAGRASTLRGGKERWQRPRPAAEAARWHPRPRVRARRALGARQLTACRAPDRLNARVPPADPAAAGAAQERQRLRGDAARGVRVAALRAVRVPPRPGGRALAHPGQQGLLAPREGGGGGGGGAGRRRAPAPCAGRQEAAPRPAMAAIDFFGYLLVGLGPLAAFFGVFVAPKSFVVLLSVFRRAARAAGGPQGGRRCARCAQSRPPLHGAAASRKRPVRGAWVWRARSGVDEVRPANTPSPPSPPPNPQRFPLADRPAPNLRTV